MPSLVDPREFVIYFYVRHWKQTRIHLLSLVDIDFIGSDDMESGSSHEVHYRTVELWVDGPMTKCND